MTEQSNIEFAPSINEKILTYLDLLLSENEKFNLTAITNRDEAIVKHLQDSLAVKLWEPWENIQIGLDLGTGGGLPGIPLAISCPNKHFILLESSQKKVKFLRFAVEELDVNNVEILNGRAEELGRDKTWREKMDCVFSRAVASLNILMELSYPFIKVNGHLLAYKGPGITAELEKIRTAKAELYAGDPAVIHYRLMSQYGERSLAIMEKLQATPTAYPRRTGIPEKRPL